MSKKYTEQEDTFKKDELASRQAHPEEGKRRISWVHPFGPLIIKSTISDELHKILLTVAEQLRNGTHPNKDINTKTNDFRNHLAGNLAEEYSYEGAFTRMDDMLIQNELTGLAAMFTKIAGDAGVVEKNGEMVLQPADIFLGRPLWVNFMKSGEWNPAHNHSGDISCVMYLQVPPEILEENKTSAHASKSNSPTAGCLEFQFGNNGMQYCTGNFGRLPKVKDIYMFPAQLAHQVYPFQSQVERISVSCNFATYKGLKVYKDGTPGKKDPEHLFGDAPNAKLGGD